MNALFFNQSLMSGVKAFGVDLDVASLESLEDAVNWADLSLAMESAKAIIAFTELNECDTFDGHGRLLPDQEENLLATAASAGLDISKRNITTPLNAIVTTNNLVIFYIDEENDRTSSLLQNVIRALSKTMTMGEVMKTSLWSTYCKRS